MRGCGESVGADSTTENALAMAYRSLQMKIGDIIIAWISAIGIPVLLLTGPDWTAAIDSVTTQPKPVIVRDCGPGVVL